VIAELAVQAGAELGEAPVWGAEPGTLHWLDLLTGDLHSWRPGASIERKVMVDAPTPLGGIVRSTAAGELLLAHAGGLSTLDIEDGRTHPIADPIGRLPNLVFNDIKTDRSGRLWLGTADVTEADHRGILYRQDGCGPRALGFDVADAGFAVCNGPAFSADGATLYLSDSAEGRVLSYELDEMGIATGRRTFVQLADDEGLPDGITVDTEGGLWVAHWNGAAVSRFDCGGRLTERIEVPTPLVTSVTFGGDDLRTLFITTAGGAGTPGGADQAGSLFTVHPGVTGIAEVPWGVAP
jgi:D-xylonolactonase